jgi:hypothetical protein
VPSYITPHCTLYVAPLGSEQVVFELGAPHRAAVLVGQAGAREENADIEEMVDETLPLLVDNPVKEVIDEGLLSEAPVEEAVEDELIADELMPELVDIGVGTTFVDTAEDEVTVTELPALFMLTVVYVCHTTVGLEVAVLELGTPYPLFDAWLAAWLAAELAAELLLETADEDEAAAANALTLSTLIYPVWLREAESALLK